MNPRANPVMAAKAAIHAFPAARPQSKKNFHPQITQINAERNPIRNLRKSAKSADKIFSFLFKGKGKEAALFEPDRAGRFRPRFAQSSDRGAQKLLLVFTRDFPPSPGLRA
jgi:hypothetical protein